MFFFFAGGGVYHVSLVHILIGLERGSLISEPSWISLCDNKDIFPHMDLSVYTLRVVIFY